MTKRELPRNRNLPDGISLLRKLNALANPKTLNLGLGKPEEDMPEALRPLALAALQVSKLDYTENAGDLSTREALSRRYNLSSGRSLILTHGAQEGLMAALIAILNPGDEVLVPDPGFLAYATMVKIQGGKSVPYSLPKKSGSYVHALKSIESRITTRTRVILVSSPGNPTGCDISEEAFASLTKIAERKNIIILSDEVYGMLHYSKPYVPLAKLHDQVISVTSFSKSHALTGWRIGMIASENPDLTKACLIAHQYLATCASVPAQRFLASLLASRLFDEVASEYRIRYAKKLALFDRASSQALRDATPTACGGFYLFPELPGRQNSLEFCEKLLSKENLLAIPGSVFGKRGEGSIRISLAIPDSQVKTAAQILSRHFAAKARD